MSVTDGVAIAVSITGHCLNVPVIATLPQSRVVLQSRSTVTGLVICGTTVTFPDPSHIVLPSVDDAVSVTVYGPPRRPETSAVTESVGSGTAMSPPTLVPFPAIV